MHLHPVAMIHSQVLCAVIGTLASDYLLVVMLLVRYLCARLHIHLLTCQRKLETMNRIQRVLVSHCVHVYCSK